MKHTWYHIAVGVVILVVVFGLGYMLGQRADVQVDTRTLPPLMQQQRSAMMGVVSEMSGDELTITEDDGTGATVFRFRRTTDTVVTKLVSRDNSNSKDPLANIFPFTSVPGIFADIKIDDRLYVRADQPLDPDTTNTAVEIKIQP